MLPLHIAVAFEAARQANERRRDHVVRPPRQRLRRMFRALVRFRRNYIA